jgi:hypothetical protein
VPGTNRVFLPNLNDCLFLKREPYCIKQFPLRGARENAVEPSPMSMDGTKQHNTQTVPFFCIRQVSPVGQTAHPLSMVQKRSPATACQAASTK